jgi:hypothetical protein
LISKPDYLQWLVIMSEKKGGVLNKKQKKFIATNIVPALKLYNLKEWQEACVSFAPPHYAKMTRKMWFNNNKKRIDSAREIVEFIEGWTQTFRENSDFECVSKGTIREEIIELVRSEQERLYSTRGRVNVVKLSGFKTLIRWADRPALLNDGPYGGKLSIPDSGRIVRKKSGKGKKSRTMRFMPPEIDLSAKPIIWDGGRVNLEIVLINKYNHPYQNVELEFNFNQELEVISISPFGWSPEDMKAIVGFVPASLDDEPTRIEGSLELMTKNNMDRCMFSAIIHFDNTEKGVREKTKRTDREIRIR